MNSRERLLKTLAGEIPDRVPVSTYELVGYNSRSFENNQPSYTHLMDVIREKADCIVMWNPGSNGTFLLTAHPVEIESTQETIGDTTVTRGVYHTPKGDLTTTAKRIAGQHTVWRTERMCKTLDDVDSVLSVPYEPPVYDASDYERIKVELGDRGIVMSSIGDPLCIAAELMEFGEYTIWAMTETEHFIRTLDTLHEQAMENLRRMLDANVVDLYRICGPEYATPPYLPPELFRRFVVPYVRETVELIHAKGSRARLHCHGKVGRVIGAILETGAVGLDPCEGPPDGDIQLSELKQRVGDRMTIFGNIQLKLLEHGSKEDVERTVRECMASAKTGGRYVIMPTAAPINIPLADKTAANYVTYMESALKYGQY